MSRVTLTINLELDTPNLPSCEAMSAAITRAERAAARVFIYGDRGGPMHVKVEESEHPIPRTCESLDILPGRINATKGSRRPKAPQAPARPKPPPTDPAQVRKPGHNAPTKSS
jgi:hypothetical protein